MLSPLSAHPIQGEADLRFVAKSSSGQAIPRKYGVGDAPLKPVVSHVASNGRRVRLHYSEAIAPPEVVVADKLLQRVLVHPV